MNRRHSWKELVNVPKYVVVCNIAGLSLVWLGKMSEKNEERALRNAAHGLQTLCSVDIVDKIKGSGHLYWEDHEDFELFRHEGELNRKKYEASKQPQPKRRSSRMEPQGTYPIPPREDLLEIQQWEWSRWRTKKDKIDWLVDEFAPRYGITTWTKKKFRDATKNHRPKMNAIWAQYRAIDKTAQEIANVAEHFPNDLDRLGLSIGDWPNPYLPDEPTPAPEPAHKPELINTNEEEELKLF